VPVTGSRTAAAARSVLRSAAALVILSFVLPSSTARAACPGDCNGDGVVTINELILAVNIALGDAPISACPAIDANHSGEVTIEELILAIANAQRGCP